MNAQTYKIKVTIEKEAQLKGVRAYMVLSKLQEYADILGSTPELEVIEKGNIEDSFEIIFSSKEPEQGILDDIRDISEIEHVELEIYSSVEQSVTEEETKPIEEMASYTEVVETTLQSNNNQEDISMKQVIAAKENQIQPKRQAAEKEKVKAIEVEKKYIVFQIDTEEYAIAIDYVMSIERSIKVTRVPNLPAHILGVINLRGIVVPVMDLKHKFTGVKAEITETTRIIVCRYDSLDVGFFVDAANDISTVHNDLIEAAPDIEKSEATEYIEALIHMKKRIIILLNVEKLFKQSDF